MYGFKEIIHEARSLTRTPDMDTSTPLMYKT